MLSSNFNSLLKTVWLISFAHQIIIYKGGSPGLVVLGEDSCSKGHELESQHHILDGHFSHLFVVKIVMCVWKDENKLKRRPGLALFKKTGHQLILFLSHLSFSLPFLSILMVKVGRRRRFILPTLFHFTFLIPFKRLCSFVLSVLFSSVWYISDDLSPYTLNMSRRKSVVQ